MILQIYSEIGEKLIGNLEEVEVVRVSTRVKKAEFEKFYRHQVLLEREVFTIKDCMNSASGKELIFTQVLLEKSNSHLKTVYIQNLVTSYVLNDEGKTLRRINE